MAKNFWHKYAVYRSLSLLLFTFDARAYRKAEGSDSPVYTVDCLMCHGFHQILSMPGSCYAVNCENRREGGNKSLPFCKIPPKKTSRKKMTNLMD